MTLFELLTILCLFILSYQYWRSLRSVKELENLLICPAIKDIPTNIEIQNIYQRLYAEQIKEAENRVRKIIEEELHREISTGMLAAKLGLQHDHR